MGSSSVEVTGLAVSSTSDVVARTCVKETGCSVIYSDGSIEKNISELADDNGVGVGVSGTLGDGSGKEVAGTTAEVVVGSSIPADRN